jgi:PKD repeat protein
MRSLVLVAVLVSSPIVHAREWQAVNPLPVQADLNGVAVLGNDRQIAVGDGGVILERAGNGPWSRIESGVEVDLNDVLAFGDRILAVGDDGTVLTRDPTGSWNAALPVTGADLFGLAAGPLGLIAVGDGGEVVTSTDGVEWVERNLSTPTLRAAAWFAGRWLAVGDAGVLVSSPDGIDWTVLEIAGRPDLIDIACADGLVALLDGDGWVHGSADGEAWWSGGSGPFSSHRSWTALTQCRGVFYLAGRGIGMRTTRNLVGWSTDFRSIHGFDFRDLACTGDGFLGVAAGGQIAETTFDVLWHGASGNGGHDLSSAAVVDGRVVVGGGDWILADVYEGPAYTPSGFVWISDDGTAWSEAGTSIDPHVISIAANDESFVVATVGFHSRVGYWFDLYLTDNGEDWEEVEHGDDEVRSVIWDGSQWLVLGDMTLELSFDARAWVQRMLPPNATGANAVASSGTIIVLVKDDGRILRSDSDGFGWTEVSSPTAADLRSVAWGHGRFVAVGDEGTVLVSFDGESWVAVASAVGEDLNRVRVHADGFVVVGDGGQLLTSEDGGTWVAETVPPAADLRDVVELDGRLMVFGTNGLILREIESGSGAPVEAGFSWRPQFPEPGDVVRFTSRSLGDPTVFDWAFGDGGTASGEVVDYVFEDPGSYAVELSVAGQGGGDTSSEVVTVDELCAAYEAPVMLPVVIDPVDGSATFSWSHEDDPLLFETDFSSSPLFPPSDFPQPNYTPETSETVPNRWPNARTTYLRVRAGRRCPGGWVLSPWSDSAVFLHEPRATADDAVRWLIPAAAHTPGVGRTFWTTELVLFNPDARTVSVAVELQGEATGSTSRSLRSGETMAIDDVVADLVEGDAVGSLVLGSDGPVVATSRTSTTSSSGGSYGQLIPAYPIPRPYGSGGRIIGLARTGSFRANLGFASGWSEPSEILTRFLAADDGTLLEERTDSLDPWGHLQLNDVLAGIGSGEEIEGVQASVVVPGLDAEVAIYASVVDNRTGDPTLRERAAPPVSGTMVVPTVARVEGVAGSLWRSELVLANRADAASSCRISWLRRGADNTEPLVAVRELGAAASLVIGDVVWELYGSDGAGALTIACTPNTVAATSRTFAVDSDGSYGQGVAAMDLESALAEGERGVLTGISEGAQSWTGERSNVGLVSLCAEPMTVDEVVLNPDGSELARRSVELGPFDVVQHNRVLASVGGADGQQRTMEVSTATPGCRFAAWASIVDNRTHDPVFVAATVVPPEVEPSNLIAVLDTREALVIDALPQAVGVPTLPEGPHRLTVVGNGTLGAVGRPLYVLCMWRSTSGALEAGALPLGGAAYEVAGQAPLWCVVPDLVSCDDNSGRVEVEIDGAGGPLALELDPAVNCVEIDDVPGSREIRFDLTHWWTEIDALGDLGRSSDRPLAVLLAKDRGLFRSTQQRAWVIRHGDQLLELDVPAWAVVIDLGTAADNRGELRFVDY